MSNRPKLSEMPKTVDVEEYCAGLDAELRIDVSCEGWFRATFTVILPMGKARKFLKRFKRQVQRSATEKGAMYFARRVANRLQGRVEPRT